MWANTGANIVCEDRKYTEEQHTTILSINSSVLSFYLITASPITEPCVFGPYSIADVYTQDEVQITFTPLYVTYFTKRECVLEADT